MVKQDISNQYDDDLTLGTDEYDDSYYTDADDLFDFSTNDESPISRLKSLVLSIDWEITDEVLLQFNEELIALRGIWAGNSINLVYVQALEKISKYIYQNKANSHPNAIKLLLTLYHNLEKIVSTDDLSEAQKKEILIEDVKRFEGLKRQISKKPQHDQSQPTARPQESREKKEAAPEDKLLNLKAIVLGIDWEITDQDLNDLRREVVRLEGEFANSKPKLILLQGIGTLGAYIKNKKSNAHADAFKVLHLFYESLEKIVKASMNVQEEKAVLFPAVDKFNEFKALLGPTISPEVINKKADDEDEEEDDEFEGSGSGTLAPALADAADEEMGFQAEEEARSLGIENPDGVSSQIDNFFGEPASPPEAEEESGGWLAEEETSATGDDAAVMPSVDRNVALQGIDVGPDDEEEDAEDYEPAVAALADTDEDAVSEWSEVSADEDEAVAAMDEKPAPGDFSEEEIDRATDSLFEDEEVSLSGNASGIDREIALQGVNVETEADEDTDEFSLPMDGGEFAPALLSSEEESLFSAETLKTTAASGGIDEEIAGTLDELFENDGFPATAPEPAAGDSAMIEATGEDSFGETEVESLQEPDVEDSFVEVESEIFGATDIGQPENSETVAEGDEEANVTVNEEEELGLFFAESELEQNDKESAAVDSLFESLEPAITEADEEISAEVDEPLPGVDEAPAEETLSFDEEIAFAEKMPPVEELSPVAEPLSFAEDEYNPIEEEISFAEESSPLEEDISPAVEPSPIAESISFAEGEFTPAEEEIIITRETPLLEEDLSSAVEPPPVAEASPFEEVELSLKEEILPAEEITFSENAATVAEIYPVEETSPATEQSLEETSAVEDDFDVALSPAEEASLIAATGSSVDDILEEEEVVFELADEPVETESTDAATPAPVQEEPEPVFADEIAEELPPAFFETIQDEVGLPFAAAGLTDPSTMTSGPLAGLGGCIESLGIELNDGIINGLFREINVLRQRWATRPLEKTFLQLISTITQHIDRYRFEASAEAHNLLRSVYNALSATRQDDLQYNQELLLAETLKVLEWQQGMLTRQVMQKGGQLTLAAPVGTEAEQIASAADAREDFDQLLQQYEETEDAGMAEQFEAIAGQQPTGRRGSLAAELKQEIASLRLALQEEIAELRNELKGR